MRLGRRGTPANPQATARRLAKALDLVSGRGRSVPDLKFRLEAAAPAGPGQRRPRGLR